MRKLVIPVLICCIFTIICFITIVFLFFLSPQNALKIQIAALYVNIIISIATIFSTIGAFIIAIKSPVWIKDANKTNLVLEIQNQFPYRTKTEIKEIRISTHYEYDNFFRPVQVKKQHELIYETYFYRFKIDNITNNFASNVQVYMEHLRLQNSNKDLDNFLPMFLKWSYTQQIQSDKIIQGMG